MRTALVELAEYYNGVFARREPPIKVFLKEVVDFSIRINRGKLTQIIDNLVLNSEYWLLEDARLSRVKEPQIVFEIEEPWVRVSDNGRGIDPELEASIFEPFVSGKAPGTGRGLGLYIVQQLLQAEGCGITLTPERNTLGRRYVFQIDFSGAINGGSD
jgi:signal transduction histidine kinase